jgi:cytochrome b involved in lipid metabolism
MASCASDPSCFLTLANISVASSFSNKTPEVITPIEETSPRNDTVVDATTTEEVVTVKSYSLAEVALHDKDSDCWLVIDGKVIDPTDFIAKGLHPNDKILNGCGKDATSMFKSVDEHDGGKAKMALKQYEIGVLK